jgi:uncharacterized protein (TIGR00255 family)
MNSKLSGVHSMTGYGTASADHPSGGLSIELRSVNSRYLDLAFRLPDDLRALEPMLRESLSSRGLRGKIDCRAAIQARTAARPAVLIRPGALQALHAAQSEVRRHFADAAPLTVADCLRFPGVIDDAQPDADQWVVAFRPLIEIAIDELLASRAREGARLAGIIRQRAQAMSAIVVQVQTRAPALVAQYGERLSERLREAAATGLAGSVVPLDEALARIRQEVSLHAMRVDVAEELNRLEIHITEMIRVIDQGGQVGKRLDFLMQELNREANTLGSKATGIDVTQASVELKLLIDQIREQVQNLE